MNRYASAALALMMSLTAVSAAAPAAGAVTESYVSAVRTTVRTKTDKTDKTDTKKETKKEKKLYGWQTIDKKKYYYGKKGVPLKGWKRLNGSQYFFDTSTGEMTVGFLDINKDTYYFDKDGKMKTGFQTIDKKKYWFSNEGKMLKDTEKKIDGKYYTFDKDGVIVNSGKSEGGARVIVIDSLRHRKELSADLSSVEWQEAYGRAVEITEPLLSKSKGEQLQAVVDAVHARKNDLLITDGMLHSNDVYGFFFDNITTQLGTARATGLCLDTLNIDYEYVTGGWTGTDTWLRVKVGNDYYVVDSFNGYYVKETSAYHHPYL
ncbi:MAG: hypothetical protein J6I96_01745 [Oscillospiraceae bacterium]|nr:hypothetical protein [Oscillospiraceae bacterium]